MSGTHCPVLLSCLPCCHAHSLFLSVFPGVVLPSVLCLLLSHCSLQNLVCRIMFFFRWVGLNNAFLPSSLFQGLSANFNVLPVFAFSEMPVVGLMFFKSQHNTQCHQSTCCLQLGMSASGIVKRSSCLGFLRLTLLITGVGSCLGRTSCGVIQKKGVWVFCIVQYNVFQ